MGNAKVMMGQQCIRVIRWVFQYSGQLGIFWLPVSEPIACVTGDGAWAADDGPLGNLRYDSALMGAISSQRGLKVPSNRVPVSAPPTVIASP